MDHRDVLLAGGEEGYALSWMDARVGDWVVTPRRGKPIEINALWYNALRLTGDWCERALRPAGPYRQIAGQAHGTAHGRLLASEGGLLSGHPPLVQREATTLRSRPRSRPTPRRLPTCA